MLHHLAFDDCLHHVAHARALGEDVFAGLELAARLEREHPADENQAVLVDHAFAPQQVGDFHHAEAGRDVDHLVLRERAGRLEPALAEHDGATPDQERQDQHRENGVADDHQRVARAP